MQAINYVAILGFASSLNFVQENLAQETARKLAEKGLGVGVGNLSGTFDHALRSAKAHAGMTIAIVEQALSTKHHDDCDVLLVVSSQQEKHQALSDQCCGAIVIGGGPGTQKLIDRFLEKGKRIVALEGSGGIVPLELDRRVALHPTVDRALEALMA